MGRFLVGVALIAGCSFDSSGPSTGDGDGGPHPGIDAMDGDGAPDDPDAGEGCTASALDFVPDDWIEVTGEDLALTNDFTVGAWVKPRSIDGELHVVSSHDHGASQGYVLMTDDGAPAFRVYFPDDQGPPSDCHCENSDQVIAADQWSHIAGSFVDGTSYLFRDGVLIEICDCQELCGGCQTGAVAAYPGPMAIGIETARFDRFATDGLIDDVHVVASPYNASFDPFQYVRCTAESLLLFPFDAPVGQELTSECSAAATGQLGSAAVADPNDPDPVESDCPPK